MELLLRRTSPTDQKTNIINQLLERSDTFVLPKQITTIKKKFTCLKCGSHKHNIKGHSKPKMSPQKGYDSEDMIRNGSCFNEGTALILNVEVHDSTTVY